MSEQIHPPVQISPIGYVATNYASPGVTPPQSSENAQERAQVVLYEQYAEGLIGLDGYSHIWLVTWLHSQDADEAAQLQCVPRGRRDGQPRGVFATRSPNRPSRLGMSLVRLLEISGNVVHFQGVDLVNGTPVLDIKPWVRSTDVAQP
jgi:tRNA (adenine37-N6)-methyltransferase